MEALTEGLNPEQLEVVYHDQGPLLVGAVAGSGKTQALIRRIGYLVSVRGVDPTRILAVTFSKSGAEEMQKRLDSLIGDSGARIGTFHSLGLEIMKNENHDYRTWQVDDHNRYRVFIKEAVGYSGMKWQTADVTILEHYIELCKGDCARPGSKKAIKIAKKVNKKSPRSATDPIKMNMAYEEAEEIRKSRRFICFDDMLMEAVEFLQIEEVRRRWADKYDYILQDEAQDQNWCQFQIGEFLAREHRNYMLVGDPSQTIFSWRGAAVERFLQFKERWNARLIVMNRNYRCGRVIISTANSLLTNMADGTHLETKMVCERPNEGDVSINSYANLDKEGHNVAQRIQELLVDNANPRDIAVLYRTNAQSRSPEEALILAGIPYRVIGSINFYRRKEVKNLLSYFRVAMHRGDFDDVAGSINSPFRYLGKAFLEKIKEEAGSEWVQDWSAVVSKVCEQKGIQARQKQSAKQWIDIIKRISTRAKDSEQGSKPASILASIVRETGYKEWLKKEEGEESTENSRVSNVTEMVRAAGRFNTIDDLLDYVDKNLESSRKQNKKGGIPDKVTLCSIHRSKGLEWPHVFIIGACEDILPHRRCDDLEEERRLFYVGITRARDRLEISSVREIAVAGNLLHSEPSRFIKEING